jgi:hypothetical protein
MNGATFRFWGIYIPITVVGLAGIAYVGLLFLSLLKYYSS